MFIESNNYRFKLTIFFLLWLIYRENRGGEDVRTESWDESSKEGKQMTTFNNLVGIGLSFGSSQAGYVDFEEEDTRAGQGCVILDTLAEQEGLKWKKYSKGARRIRSERRWHYKRK